jgi:hypothetical protein
MRHPNGYQVLVLRLVVAAVVGAASSMSLPATVFAQAGSTGGTIGKTDKSISGGEEREAPSRAGTTQRARKATARSGEISTEGGSRCGNIAGAWKWNWALMSIDAVFRSDGTANATGGLTAT